MDLLQISELKGFKLIDHISTIEDLLKAKFIKKVEIKDLDVQLIFYQIIKFYNEKN